MNVCHGFGDVPLLKAFPRSESVADTSVLVQAKPAAAGVLQYRGMQYWTAALLKDDCLTHGIFKKMS